MEQGHLFVSPTHHSSDLQHQHNQHSALLPAMSHTNSTHSPAQSPSSAESPVSAPTPNSSAADTTAGASSQRQQYSHHHHQQSGYGDVSATPQAYNHLSHPSSLQQSTYTSAFSSTASANSPQQQQQQRSLGGEFLYQASPQNQNPATQYMPHDQQTAALAPLHFGNLGVIGHQRPATGFAYDFDPNDSNCRNMYATADMDPSHHVPQQLSTSGYIRHGGGILVSGAQPQSALTAAHPQQQQQQSIDMTVAAAAAANLALPVDINGEHGVQGQQLQHPSQAASSMHASNPQSPFGSSPVGNQPIFTTLSFQNSQLQEYDPYARPAKRTGRTTKPKRTPRPANAFILYRKAKQAEVIRDNPGVSNKDVSCIIGQMWKGEDPSIQDQFREQAELEKKKHKEMHPNYKYQPRKPKSKRLQEAQAVGAAAVNSAMAASASQEGNFVSAGMSMSNTGNALSSTLKDPVVSGAPGSSFQQYSKYHIMMQSGQTQSPQQMAQGQHPQTPGPQHQQQSAQLGRGEEYYYRGAGAMGEPHQHVSNNGFVGVAPPLDIKPGSFVGALPTQSYWTPSTPGDAAFSNTLPSGNVFPGNGGDQAVHMRPFDSAMVQHPGAGHGVGASPAQIFHSFDGQRQNDHHHQPSRDAQGHMDYQAGQAQQYHQSHGHSQQQQQQQLGGYVNGGQTYHHAQAGMDGIDGASVAAADSQGLGLLSPPTVAWSANM